MNSALTQMNKTVCAIVFGRCISRTFIVGNRFNRNINIRDSKSILACQFAWFGSCANLQTSAVKQNTMPTLEKLNFDNLALRELPLDPEIDKPSSRQVPGACFSRIDPLPVKNPILVSYAADALALIDIDEKEVQRPEFKEYFGGCKILPGSEPAAHCYCGHQFGHFSGQLGDGAAMYLGEVVNKKGERWEIQLKGAGRTPYSRTADGRKVLRSTIREFLCSEAMHHLGIPTTRAGVCITSDSYVTRDIFYSGNNIQERCSIVLRIAPSFIRFGSFEIFKDTDEVTGRKGPSVGRTDILKTLLEYVIKTFYPEISAAHPDDRQKAYLDFFREIVKRTAQMVAHWQTVGWCHGVLNTDNMSIVGVTIDYGPYGFIDAFDPDFICNASDDGGRYSYNKQPEMCKWNCGKLAEALSPLVPIAALNAIVEEFGGYFNEAYYSLMKRKFGLTQTWTDNDKELVTNFFSTMKETGGDFTNCFRGLSKVLAGEDTADKNGVAEEVLQYFVDQSMTMKEKKLALKPRMDPRQLNMFMMLMQTNPDLLAQLGGGVGAITQELERMEARKELEGKTQSDKIEEDRKLWKAWLSKYNERVQQELAASTDKKKAVEERKTCMDNTNPRYVLRNYIAQTVIEAAEKGDYSEMNSVLKLLQNPYSEEMPQEEAASQGASCSAPTSAAAEARGASFVEKYAAKPPSWANELRVT